MTYRTPDEQVYAARASGVHMFGFLRSIRMTCDEYLNTPSWSAYPPPTRWLWTAWTHLVGVRVASALGAIACALVAIFSWSPFALAASPLLIRLSQRHLQDTTVAALVLGAIALALHGHPVLVAVCVLTLLCVKEAALPMLPAIGLSMALGGTAPLTCAVLLFLAVLWWGALTGVVCGKGRGAAVFRLSLTGHRTDYTVKHQSGMPHRLIVDLVLVSPWVVVLAVVHPSRELAIAAVMLAAHALTPVRNIRTVLAADLLLRCSVGLYLSHLGWLGVAATVVLAAYDVCVSRRLRGVFDTVTSALVGATGMGK